MKSIEYPEEMERLYAENARIKERALLLEHTLRNATAILDYEGFLYAKSIYEKFPEFRPIHKGLQ